MRPGVRRDVRRMLRFAPAAAALVLGLLFSVRLTMLGAYEKIGLAALAVLFIVIQSVINHYTDAEQAERADAQRRGERPEDSYLPWYGVLATIAIVAALIAGCLWLGFLISPAGS